MGNRGESFSQNYLLMTMMDFSPMVVLYIKMWSRFKQLLIREISRPSLPGGLVITVISLGSVSSEFMKTTQYEKASQQRRTVKYLFLALCEWPTEFIAVLYYLIWTRHRENIQIVDKVPSSLRKNMLAWTNIWDYGWKRILWATPQIQKSKQKSVLFFQCWLLFRQPKLWW